MSGNIADNGSANKQKEEKAWWAFALGMLGRFAGWIIFPVFIGAGAGMWLDKKYNSEPWLFLASVGIAFIFSIAGLLRNTLKEFKRIEKEYGRGKRDDK